MSKQQYHTRGVINGVEINTKDTWRPPTLWECIKSLFER